ncbi:MAG: tRNA (adenosine(37)-N6)-threonylcarbamoyltransferase complex dimerization subunit type 1 TsaB [Spirochaetes bacterium]|nr:tRNA (adenosine(37)-N6)-threonylcarbamoyltransferase complex dimerization subunit type 1 TsaB [Spirochaetota bacterium]
MKSLFIDTATSCGSLALFDHDNLLGSLTFNTQTKHLQALHKGIKYLLDLFAVPIDQIDLVGVDVGPGSFTGIRIGVTAARTLAQVKNLYIEGIDSLSLLASKVPFEDNIILSLIDGKKGRLFTGFFQKQRKGLKRLLPFSDIYPENVIPIIRKNFRDKKLILVGDGQIGLKKFNLPSVTFTDENYYYPEAKYMRFFLSHKKKLNRDHEKIVPFYLRRSDAEEKSG